MNDNIPAYIRVIQKSDNAAIAKIIRDIFIEFKIDRPGTAYFDECLDYMSDYYLGQRSIYYVCFYNGRLIGGAGIHPTEGLPENCCELVKMYLLPEGRGKGLGQLLMKNCLEFAKFSLYNQIYLETVPELNRAISLYTSYGFRKTDKPLGSGKHYSCTIKMIRDL